MGCLQSSAKEDTNGTAPPPIGANDAPPKKVDPRLPFDTYRQLFQMKNSWKAVARALDATAKGTFVSFFKDHPEYQALHKNIAHLESEEKMLSSTTFETFVDEYFNVLDEAMECIEKDMVDAAIANIKRQGQGHGKISGFTESYYKDMEQYFMKAVAEAMGDRFTEPTEQNFRRLYEFWTSNMIEGLTGAPPNRI